MAITVSFGKTTRDTRWLDKAPTWQHSNISCDVYGKVDRINPSIIVDSAQIDLSDCNYMSIPEFGRFYFITSITGKSAKTKIATGHVDVLHTYKDQIRQCPCIAERSTSKYNMYLADGRRLFNSYCYNDYHVIGSDIGEPDSVVLITIG